MNEFFMLLSFKSIKVILRFDRNSSLNDWSWIDLECVSSNITSSEVSLSLGHGIVRVNVLLHLSGLLGWGGVVVGWLVYDPLVVFSPGS